MSEKTTGNQNLELVSFQLSANQMMLNGLELIREKGWNTNIQTMLEKALRIYCKTVDHFGEFGHDVRLRWEFGGGNDEERSVELNYCFRPATRRGFAWVETFPDQIVKTFSLNADSSFAEKIRWTCASVGISTFHQLMELAVDFYQILVEYDSELSRKGWDLRIRKEVHTAKRHWLRPWKTYTKKVWHPWQNYNLRRLLAEW